MKPFSEAPLFSPFTQRGVTLPNRIAVAPMCQYSCSDGFATDWHLVHLGSRAIGRAGLVMAEATAVVPEGRISPLDLGLWSDAHIAPLQRITAFLAQHGAVPAIQLAHAGRKASCADPWQGRGRCLGLDEGGWPMAAPSALPFNAGDRAPQALDQAGIDAIQAAFVAAAQRAVRAGFQVIELHAAHGYLLHEFLSPLSNQRSDSYGGSLDNRLRMLLETTEKVRAVLPDELPLWVRISATDWVDGGWDLAQSITLARELQKRGVDLVDTSSGGLTPDAQIPVAPGFQVPFAEAIRRDSGIATGAVGLITEPEQANAIIAQEKADIVLLARALLRDPYWPLRAAEALDCKARWPKQYGTVVKPR